MKTIIGLNMKETETKSSMEHKPHGPAHVHPIPPNHRTIVYEEQDMPLMAEIFGDEDSAVAILEDLSHKPYEMQMLGYQLFDLICVLKEVC